MPVLTLVSLSMLTLSGMIAPLVRPEATVRGTVIVLTGAVVDGSSNRPLEGAQVYVRAPAGRVGALSNVAGRYALRFDDSWVDREMEVVVELIGYTSVRRQIRLSAGDNRADFRLQSVGLELESLVVTDAGVASGNRVAVESGRAAGGQRPEPAMRRFAAVRSLAEGSAWALRRGLDASAVGSESYARIVENGFRPVASAPLSTFSIDVDRASYANVRRFITDGVRPPVDAVRIEELINYFTYDDPTPEGSEPFAVTTEVASAPWQPEHLLVRIGVRGREIETAHLPASNFVFLLDVSGSMRSPDKLPLLKRSLRLLVDQLREEDRVAVVVYAGAAGLVLPSTSGDQKAEILAAIDRLEAGGSTAGGEGIRLAYDVALRNRIEGGNNRVILATDGDFNVGASSDADMVRLVEGKRDQGTFLTVLGFGRGNLQDAKMEQLADYGNGNFAYIDSDLEAKKVLVAEMSGTLHAIAKDVKIQVEFNPALVAEYRLLGYENRLMNAEDFNDDTKDAGELGAGHTVTALYELILAGDEDLFRSAPVDSLRFQSGSLTAAADSEELMFLKLRYKEPEGDQSRLISEPLFDRRNERGASADLRFSASVAAWGMLLRNSEYAGDFTLSDVEELARGALGEDVGGYRADFLDLVQRTRTLELTAMGVR